MTQTIDRYQYRHVISLDMEVLHIVYDLYLNKVYGKFDSKYAAKHWIKEHQEEFESDD